MMRSRLLIGETRKSRARATMAQSAIAVLAGFVVLALLLPIRGVDSDPPVCWSVFDYIVPCGNGLALAAGAATAGLVGWVLWLAGRRRRHR